MIHCVVAGGGRWKERLVVVGVGRSFLIGRRVGRSFLPTAIVLPSGGGASLGVGLQLYLRSPDFFKYGLAGPAPFASPSSLTYTNIVLSYRE